MRWHTRQVCGTMLPDLSCSPLLWMTLV
eukprot:CCRYP_012469-RG/>CCRYP_012469-RG protein AED:0.49 eAED:0.49 QI:0/-1/0/1/-1/0/1/0/27